MANSKTVTLSVVIPCYRSAGVLDEVVERVLASVQCDTEIVLVNDASPDETWQVIRELTQRHSCVRGIDMMTNVGQYRATLCGLEMSQGEYVVTIDDDLQHAPEDIPAVLDHLRQSSELDCVLAQFPRKRHNVIRRIGTAIMERAFRTFYGKPPGVQATSFRALTRKLVDCLCDYRSATPVVNAMIFQATRRIGTVEVEHHVRKEGTSGYGLIRLLSLFIDNILSVSILPLRCISIVGVGAACSSFLLAGFYLWRYLTDQIHTAGFPTIVLLIIFFGGLTLISIGLVGEYLIRILREVQGRPRYSVRETVGINVVSDVRLERRA